jgi:hypothetical protein
MALPEGQQLFNRLLLVSDPVSDGMVLRVSVLFFRCRSSVSICLTLGFDNTIQFLRACPNLLVHNRPRAFFHRGYDWEIVIGDIYYSRASSNLRWKWTANGSHFHMTISFCCVHYFSRLDPKALAQAKHYQAVMWSSLETEMFTSS